MTAKELIQDLFKLQNAYSFTKRKLTTADRYVQITRTGLLDPSDITNEALLEPLMEHIGHLPILASYLYPHIANSEKVDLGRALIMLSIHDIGETTTGDIFTYAKSKKDEQEEYAIAIEKLHPAMRPYLDEYEAHQTLDAQYAKSIDVLAPHIHEADMPKYTLRCFKGLGGSIGDIIKKKRPHMEWDPVLLEIFDLITEQYQRAEKGEELLFPAEKYDLI